MAGRPRKPKHIKESQGTLEKSREPGNPITYDPLVSIPEISDEVPGDGKEYFEYCCRAMINQGTISAATIMKLLRAMDWYDQWRAAVNNIRKHGYYQETSTGYRAFSPDVTMMEKAEKYLTEFEREYGLTLASSQNLGSPRGKINNEDFD